MHKKPWTSSNISVFLFFGLKFRREQLHEIFNFDSFLAFSQLMVSAKTILSFHLRNIDERYVETACWGLLQACVNEKRV